MSPKNRTYPHSLIVEKCEAKFTSPWDRMECNINSLQIYYGKREKKECGDKYVDVPPI